MLCASLHPEAMLAFFQSTQLNLFERFLTQARAGIDSTGITSGMQNVAYVVLLVGFLWQVYQSALHGGDVRGLGTSLIKYVVTAIVVMNYGTVFTTINQGFVNAGNWVSNASGGNVSSKTGLAIFAAQYSQAGFQQTVGPDHRIYRRPDRWHPNSCCLSPLSNCGRDFRFLLYLLRQHSVYFRADCYCSDASRRREPPCQVLHREYLRLECLADPLRRLWRAAHRSSDGPDWADAQPERLPRRAWKPRRLTSDRHREHCLLSGDRQLFRSLPNALSAAMSAARRSRWWVRQSLR